MRQDAVTRDRRYGPLTAKRSEGRKEGSHIFAPINVKFGTAVRSPVHNFTVYRGNMSPLRGEKPIFRPLSKNNTGMAALRAGLPVKITYISLVTDMISIYRKETISKVQM